eukprot:scaffold231729_cov46-Prasinocladus_malaysianus.AAC.1
MALLWVPMTAFGCGMLQHNEIVHRSMKLLDQPASWSGRPPDWVRDLLIKYPEEVQAGAPSPDFGYVCFHDHGAGEDMHWSPFQIVHQEYASRTNPDTPSWIMPNQLCTQEQGGINFHCDGALCQRSHSVGDTGSEFVLAQQTDTSWLGPSWTVPVSDIQNILAGMNHSVQVDNIPCHVCIQFARGL